MLTISQMFYYIGHLAGILDREHPEPDQVCDAEPVVQAEGREGHGEVREGQEIEGQGCQDSRRLLIW